MVLVRKWVVVSKLNTSNFTVLNYKNVDEVDYHKKTFLEKFPHSGTFEDKKQN